jgi:hypothetical protein
VTTKSAAPRRDPRSRCSRRRSAGEADETPQKRGDSPAQAFRRIGRRRRLPGEHRSERSEPLDIAGASERSNQTGSRAPLSGRTSERPASATAISSQSCWPRASEEDSGFQSAIRAERAPASGAIKPERAPASGAIKMAEAVAARLAPQGDTAHIHLRSASAAPVPRTNGRTQP